MIRFRLFLGSEVCTECVARGRLDRCLRTACVFGYERREPRGSHPRGSRTSSSRRKSKGKG